MLLIESRVAALQLCLTNLNHFSFHFNIMSDVVVRLMLSTNDLPLTLSNFGIDGGHSTCRLAFYIDYNVAVAGF